MKRQEALESILENLSSHIGYKHEELCQVILHDLEELGMAPPFYDRIQYDPHFKGMEVIIPAREWEDDE